MTDEQIKHMAERFLGWKLPDNFNPDGGVSFTPIANAGSPYEHRHTPTGTNLLTYTQALAMVQHMLEGLPAADEAAQVPALKARVAADGWLAGAVRAAEATLETPDERQAAIVAIIREFASTQDCRGCPNMEPNVSLNQVADWIESGEWRR